MQNKIQRYYKIADIQVVLNTPYFDESEILSVFRTDKKHPDITYDISFVDQVENNSDRLDFEDRGYEVYYEGLKRVRLFRHDYTGEAALKDIEESEQLHTVSFSQKYMDAWGDKLILKILDLPRQIILHDGIFLHTSFVIWKGKAILFSGNKRVGKSTQAELWKHHRHATIANGDRAILRQIDGTWCACGSPYCGMSNICENINCPIQAIVILSQSQKNTVSFASPREALISLLDNSSFETWDKNQVEKVMTIAEQIITTVPFVKLGCVPDKSAVEALEEFLWQQKE